MKKMNVFAVFISLIAVTAGAYFLFQGGYFGAITPTSGCQFINNEENPGSAYTTEVTSESYTCQSDECVVKGKLTLTTDDVGSMSRVVWRWSGDYIAGGMIPLYSDLYVDSDNDGVIEHWEYYTAKTFRASSSVKFDGQQNSFIPCAPGGYCGQCLKIQATDNNYANTGAVCIGNYYSDRALYIGKNMGSSSYVSYYVYIYKDESEDYSITPLSIPCDTDFSTFGMEKCKEISTYSADFNFCLNGPGDYDNDYCNGDESFITTDTEITLATKEYKLYRAGSVQFNPINWDNSGVDNHIISVKNYDCSCNKQPKPSVVCDPGTTYCKEETPDVVYYCDNTQNFGESICNVWGSPEDCPGNQQCFLDSGTGTGTGLGGCKCSASDVCTIGDKRTGTSGESSYQICTDDSGCPAWSNDVMCCEGLVFSQSANNGQGDCILPEDNACEYGQAQCVGNKIRMCEFTTLCGKSGYQWSDVTENCPGEKVCYDKVGSYDVCSCDGVDSCELGDKKCINNDEYEVCTKSPLEASSCYKYRNLGDSCSVDIENGICDNNICIVNPFIGCAYDTPGYECYEQLDANGIVIERCDDSSNMCKCSVDQYTATSIDYGASETRCYDNRIQKVTKYGRCYRWEDTLDCSLTSEICVKQSPAQCLPPYNDVGIIVPAEIGVGRPIGEVVVHLVSGIEGGIANQLVTIWIEDSSGTQIQGTRKDLATASDGKVTFSYVYAHNRPDTLTIKVLVGDNKYPKDMQINIKEALEFSKLSCNPPIGLLDREIQCIYEISESSTGNVLVVRPEIRLEQLNQELYYESFTGVKRGIMFVPGSISPVTFYIDAEKDGYISASETIVIEIQDVTITQDFQLDGKDYFSFGGSGLTPKTHKLTLVLQESGYPLDISYIIAEMSTPAGGYDDVSFVDKGNGVWEGSYTFEQGGHTYTLSAQAYPKDPTERLPPPLIYDIVTTSGSSGGETASTLNTVIISSAVGVVVLIVIIVAIVMRRRK